MEPKHRIRGILRGRDRGSVTVLALLVLVIMTLLGMGVLTTSNSDSRAAQNENSYRRNFSRAEAAVRAGMQALQNAANTPDANGKLSGNTTGCTTGLRDYTLCGLHKAAVQGVLPDPNDTTLWTAAASVADLDANCRYYILETKIEGSLDATASQIRTYVIFGRSSLDRGEAIIRVGYRVRLQPAV